MRRYWMKVCSHFQIPKFFFFFVPEGCAPVPTEKASSGVPISDLDGVTKGALTPEATCDTIAIWLAYDTAVPSASNRISHGKATRYQYVHNGQKRRDDDATRCVVHRSVVNTSSRIYDLCHRRRKWQGCYRAVFGYVSTGEGTNV